MAKLLSLNESFIPEFENILGGGMLLGPLLKTRGLGNGTLSTWISEGLGKINPHQLRSDIFYPHPFQCRQELYGFIDNFFKKNHDGILIADTPQKPSLMNDQKALQGLNWFSCDLPGKKNEQTIAVYITFPNAEHAQYNAVLDEAWPYPTTILLTSLPPGKVLQNDAYYRIDSEIIRHLIERVDHILLGVFDERSMAVWTPKSF